MGASPHALTILDQKSPKPKAAFAQKNCEAMHSFVYAESFQPGISHVKLMQEVQPKASTVLAAFSWGIASMVWVLLYMYLLQVRNFQNCRKQIGFQIECWLSPHPFTGHLKNQDRLKMHD